MYSSVYGPSSSMGSSYGGMSRYRDPNIGLHNSYNRYGGSSTVDLSSVRRYAGGRSECVYPSARYRPPLPTYTVQSVSRSSSYANSSANRVANHNKVDSSNGLSSSSSRSVLEMHHP